ncbi:unnamed protein product [Toxocara canis]|uniref:Latrophilin-3 n=1 Tax=Toxocara canis TaxID=6265 RepID=A0A183UG53_TOXCA|nr:unnamed protein product [Toxocara canis]
MAKLIAEATAHRMCRRSEAYYNGKCYQLFPELVSWDKAAGNCKQTGGFVDFLSNNILDGNIVFWDIITDCIVGSLAMVENDSERQFISAYLQAQTDSIQEDCKLYSDYVSNEIQSVFRSRVIKGFFLKISILFTDRRAPGVWLAGHSVANYSEAVYVWMPEHYLIRNNYWQRGQPVTYTNLADVCIFLDEQSIFLDWITSPCSRDRYYLCQRDAVDDGEQLMNAQCMCINGYIGEFCQIPSHKEGKPTQSQSVACSNQPFEFACSSGATIEVDFATYGYISTYPTTQLCGNDAVNGYDSVPQESCISSSSLQTIKNKCQGLTFCKIDSLSSLFPDDPCPKYVTTSLLYRMRCSLESLTRCRKGAIYRHGRCYQVNYKREIRNRLSWFDASAECSEQGGSLASTIDSAVNSQLVAAMRNQTNAVANYWIGATTRASDGEPITLSGQPLGFVPSNSSIQGKNLCISYSVLPTIVAMVSVSCSDLSNWICEFAPEPAQYNRRPVEYYEPKQPYRSVFMGTGSNESSMVGALGRRVQYDRQPKLVRAAINPLWWSASFWWGRSCSLQDSSDSTEQSFCEQQEWDGLRFPRTPACQQVTLPCPNPETTIGVVIQRCSCDTAEWLSRPDTNNCAHKWISELSEAIQNNVPAENISRTFSTNLKQTLQTGIYGGDITGSVDIGEELLPLARRQYSLLLDRGERSAKATTFTEEFGEAGDELLGPVAESVWMQLDPTVRIDKASVLMSLLEQSAIMMADFIYAKQKKMGFDNWGSFFLHSPSNQFTALEVQVKRPHVYVADDVPDGPVVKSGRMRENSIEQAVGDTLDEAIRPSAFSLSAAPESENRGEKVIEKLPHYLHTSAYSFVIVIIFLTCTSVIFTLLQRTRMGSLNRNPMRLGYYVFKSVGPLLTPQGNKIINSLVIGASINNPNQSLQLPPNNPVTFTFYHIHTTDVANPQCVFWDTMARQVSLKFQQLSTFKGYNKQATPKMLSQLCGSEVWSDRGCTMLRTSDESTDCSCDHLTSFAILMDVTGKLDITLGPESAAALNIITIVGCVLSIICLLLSFLVFTCFRSLWNVRNTIHRNLCLCLLIAELTFVVGIDRTENKAVCASIAVILHYFFLASFCWMLLEGYQLYLMLIQVFEPDNVKILLYFLWAYGFPAIIVAVSAGVAWPSYGTPN